MKLKKFRCARRLLDEIFSYDPDLVFPFYLGGSTMDVIIIIISELLMWLF